jgi:hypothetical protein
VGFQLHGFHDNGLAPDTDFRINAWLRFDLTWSTTMFDEPTLKTLVASLDWLRVTMEGGIPLGAVITGVTNGIHGAFFPGQPSPEHPEVPAGAIFVAEISVRPSPKKNEPPPPVELDVLGVQISKEGELRVYVNPLRPPGAAPTTDFAILRSVLAQTELDLMKCRLLAD